MFDTRIVSCIDYFSSVAADQSRNWQYFEPVQQLDTLDRARDVLQPFRVGYSGFWTARLVDGPQEE